MKCLTFSRTATASHTQSLWHSVDIDITIHNISNIKIILWHRGHKYTDNLLSALAGSRGLGFDAGSDEQALSNHFLLTRHMSVTGRWVRMSESDTACKNIHGPGKKSKTASLPSSSSLTATKRTYLWPIYCCAAERYAFSVFLKPPGTLVGRISFGKVLSLDVSAVPTPSALYTCKN